MNARLEHTDVLLRNVHAPSKCEGPYCVIHNRSEHHMRHFPQHWREDRHIMERVCPHGVGHPDPDEMAFEFISVHGCDGCCDTPSQE